MQERRGRSFRTGTGRRGGYARRYGDSGCCDAYPERKIERYTMPVEPVGRACRKRVRFFMVLCIGLGGFASAARLRKFCGRIGGIRADGLFGERGCPPPPPLPPESFVSFWQKPLHGRPIPAADLSKWQAIVRKLRLVQPLFVRRACRTAPGCDGGEPGRWKSERSQKQEND